MTCHLRLALVSALVSACGDGDGRGTGAATAATSVTGATTAPGTAPTTDDMSSGTDAPPTTGEPPTASSTGEPVPDGTTTTGGDTLASDTFPETSAMSWFTTGGFPGTDGEQDCDMVLMATVRDFKEDHPDFEDGEGTDKGIVLPDLGPDDKPVYAGQNDNPTTTGQQNFDHWYRDVPGVNQKFPLQIMLTEGQAGLFGYDNSNFFPIDGQGFGDQGNRHNYHFTLELHTMFTYKGGETFTFRGDDDLFVFINRKLAMDLGGVHGPQEDVAVLDAKAAELGIVPGGVYQLDFFFAERHTTESNFRIETTISCLLPPG